MKNLLTILAVFLSGVLIVIAYMVPFFNQLNTIGALRHEVATLRSDLEMCEKKFKNCKWQMGCFYKDYGAFADELKEEKNDE